MLPSLVVAALLLANVQAGWRKGNGITCLNDVLYDRGIFFDGSLAVTQGGLACQAWSVQSPHTHELATRYSMEHIVAHAAAHLPTLACLLQAIIAGTHLDCARAHGATLPTLTSNGTTVMFAVRLSLYKSPGSIPCVLILKQLGSKMCCYLPSSTQHVRL